MKSILILIFSAFMFSGCALHYLEPIPVVVHRHVSPRVIVSTPNVVYYKRHRHHRQRRVIVVPRNNHPHWRVKRHRRCAPHTRGRGCGHSRYYY
jgi:hypothetical protein